MSELPELPYGWELDGDQKRLPKKGECYWSDSLHTIGQAECDHSDAGGSAQWILRRTPAKAVPRRVGTGSEKIQIKRDGLGYVVIRQGTHTILSRADDARKLAAALVAVADEIEGIAAIKEATGVATEAAPNANKEEHPRPDPHEDWEVDGDEKPERYVEVQGGCNTQVWIHDDRVFQTIESPKGLTMGITCWPEQARRIAAMFIAAADEIEHNKDG